MCGQSILYCQCGFKKIWISSWARVISEPYEFMICCSQHSIGALEIWGWAVEWLIRARDHVLGSNAVMSEVMSIASGRVFTSIEFVKMPYLIKLTMDQKDRPSSERGCFYRMLLFLLFLQGSTMASTGKIIISISCKFLRLMREQKCTF